MSRQLFFKIIKECKKTYQGYEFTEHYKEILKTIDPSSFKECVTSLYPEKIFKEESRFNEYRSLLMSYENDCSFLVFQFIGKCNSLDQIAEASRLLEMKDIRNEASLVKSKMLSFLRQSKYQSLLELFDDSKLYNPFTYGILFKALGEMRNSAELKKCRRMYFADKKNIDPISFCCLLHGLYLVQDYETVLATIEKGIQQNLIVYTEHVVSIMINSLVHMENRKTLFSWLDIVGNLMEQHTPCVDDLTTKTIEERLQLLDEQNRTKKLEIQAAKLETDKPPSKLMVTIELFNSILKCLLDLNEYGKLRQWIGYLETRKIRPSSVTFTIICQAFSHLNDLASIKLWIQRMEKYEIEPDAFQFSILLHAFTKLKDRKMFYLWLKRLELYNIKVDKQMAALIIRGLAILNDTQNLSQWIRRVTKEEYLQVDPLLAEIDHRLVATTQFLSDSILFALYTTGQHSALIKMISYLKHFSAQSFYTILKACIIANDHANYRIVSSNLIEYLRPRPNDSLAFLVQIAELYFDFADHERFEYLINDFILKYKLSHHLVPHLVKLLIKVDKADILSHILPALPSLTKKCNADQTFKVYSWMLIGYQALNKTTDYIKTAVKIKSEIENKNLQYDHLFYDQIIHELERYKENHENVNMLIQFFNEQRPAPSLNFFSIDVIRHQMQLFAFTKNYDQFMLCLNRLENSQIELDLEMHLIIIDGLVSFRDIPNLRARICKLEQAFNPRQLPFFAYNSLLKAYQSFSKDEQASDAKKVSLYSNLYFQALKENGLPVPKRHKTFDKKPTNRMHS